MHIKLKIATFCMAVIFALGAFYGCAPKRQWGEGVKVLATTTMLADLTLQIGGDRVSVIGLMRAGIDPHSYDPTIGDSKLIQDADIIIYNGLHLESRLADLLELKSHAFAASGAIPLEDLLQAEEEEGGAFDPHIWFDVPLWQECAREVARVFSLNDADNADYYAQNLQTYLQELDALDLYIRQKTEEITKSKRILITAHDAFRYFGRAYGFSVEGIQGLSTVAGYGINRINQLVDIIITNHIPAIFLESSVPDKSSRALMEGVKNHRNGFDVIIGGELHSDSIGTGSYIEAYMHNIDTIHGALTL